MRPASDLSKLEESSVHRLRRLRGLMQAPPRDFDEYLSFIVIDLDNLIQSVLQLYVGSCLSCRAKSKTSGRITTNLNFISMEHAMAFALSLLNIPKYAKLKRPSTVGLKDWPSSRDPKDWERVLVASGCSILPSFQRAISLNTVVFAQIGTIRNFYAHRNLHRAEKVRSIARREGLIGVSHADGYCMAVKPGNARSTIWTWIIEAELFFREMVA